MRDQQLHAEITRRLIRDYEFKENGAWLQHGRCPTCEKKELYTRADNPWVLRCGRANKCGAEEHVKDVYDDLFQSWSERHKATPEKPNAAADAYLRDSRGFDLARIQGWYVQEHFYKAEIQAGTATVRFVLADGVWWERLIDLPARFGKQKANFRGSYIGMWWQPPNVAEIPEEVWIVEGIFDAIALQHNGIYAVSAMTCGNYPSKALSILKEQCKAADKDLPRLVWALDAGRAGRAFTKKHVERSRKEGWKAEAAQPGEDRYGKGGLDWNDLHQRARLEEEHRKEYLYFGSLLIAKSATDKALLMYNRFGHVSFSFEFDSRLYWFNLDMGRYNKAREVQAENKELSDAEQRNKALEESNSIVEIANCFPTALYYQANLLTDESWYYFRIDFPHDGPSVKNTFTAAQLSSASEFKKRMLAVAAGSIFTGQSGQLDTMLKRWLERIKTVETVDFIGYSKEHGTYVFNDVAVKEGRIVELNDEDYFEIGKLSVKSLSKSVSLAINTDAKEYTNDWLPMVWTCYRHKGIVALAYWLGSLFAEQVRGMQQSFPFIELVGEPNAGKTTLIEFMWKLLGRQDYEGFDPSKSTIAARSRNFSQVANMPVVMIEGDRNEEDRTKQRAFDWDELKPLYNGRSVYSRGVKNGGNETYEPPFRGALVISQNAAVSASPATLQRICHVHFDLSMHSPEGKVAGDTLASMEVKHVSHFILKAARAEKAILATIAERTPVHEKRLAALPNIRNQRLVKNHAQLAAMVEALKHVVPLGAAELDLTQSFIEDMVAERQEAINQDSKLVMEFWEIYEHLNGNEDLPRLNHARKEDQVIAINLNHFVEVAAERRQQVPDLSELKKQLKANRTHPFVEIKAVNSAINAVWNRERPNAEHPRPATVKCWVFKRGKNTTTD